MCTALCMKTDDHYFGRTLDLDVSYGEKICVMPRRFPLFFRKMGKLSEHYAMIGMAAVVGGIPLYYDAANERGLSMAGLNFPGNAWYAPALAGFDNIAPYEFIPWILGQCDSIAKAKALLSRIRLIDLPFSRELPLADQHWILSDREESIVVEPMREGVRIYDNPAGVLTNNPPFSYQLFNLNNYRGVSRKTEENFFSDRLELEVYGQGLGGLGLPGDVSSMSRFARIAFNSHNSVCPPDENASVGQFFHLLGSVEMIRGCCLTESKTWDITVYTSCVNTDKGRYYYTTYDNRQIGCVDMHKEDLNGEALSVFELEKEQRIFYQN